MHKIATSALATFAVAIISIPAGAEIRSVPIPYADLDLSSPQGIATLEGRIRAATKHICGDAEVRNLRDSRDQQRCIRETRTSISVEIARLARTQPTLALSRLR